MPESETFRILVVDDEQAARYSIKRALGKEGHEITEAASGEEALKMLASGEGDPPDLVLLDLSMPGMDGMETLAKIREM
ncbi:MAG: response regulator, partial [Planctomycetota bacterium]